MEGSARMESFHIGWKALAVLVGACTSDGFASPLHVEQWSTVSTAARPEVHLLLRNASSRPMNFTLELAGVRGGPGLDCAGTNTPEPDFLTRFHYWNGVSFADSRGLIPAHGWTHRAIVLGELGVIPPCEVPYRLQVEDSEGETAATVQGVIVVPVAGPAVRADASASDISWEAMVEWHRLYSGRIVARLAVKNKRDHGIVVQLDHRTLSCEGSGSASWAGHHGVVQGEDVGPLQIDANSWGVFVAAIDIWNTDDPAKCTASADLLVDTERGLRRIERLEFPLSPEGFLDAATKGRR